MSRNIDLICGGGIRVSYNEQWHNATDVNHAEEYVNYFSKNAQVEQIHGPLPALESIQLRSPWEHIVKGTEIWTPSMRILDMQGNVRMQCTKGSGAETYALFGDLRQKEEVLVRDHGRTYEQARAAGTGACAVRIKQGLPLQEEWADPNAKHLKESPLWTQVVATVQHLRETQHHWFAHCITSPGQAGAERNTYAMHLPFGFEKSVDRYKATPTAYISADGTKDPWNECLLNLPSSDHHNLPHELQSVLNDVSVQMRKVGLFQQASHQGEMWNIRRNGE